MRRPALTLLAVLLVLATAGCGTSSSPTPASERPPSTTVAELPPPSEDDTDLGAEDTQPSAGGPDDYYDSGSDVDGNAEMQKLYDQELEAQMAEVCAKDPSAPFC